ncbi:MAG TPA: cupredoxin domain-containing protein [Candidatus Limnocylindrales bacterium]|nr:cupredoxin domain-containing protein [Candidatus Limnocylindrales bacterium]
MRRLALSLLAIFAIVGLAACGGGATPTPASSSALTPPSAAGSAAAGAACATAAAGATATVNVSIKDFKFSPQPVQAKVGDVVAWKNDDTAPHSATMDAGTCDTDTITTGSSAMLVFTAAGTYTYHCKIHPGQMKDFTVEVK